MKLLFQETLSLQQKQVALKDHPTFLEIAGFSYFPASFIVGPQFSMKRYLDFVQGRFTSISPDGVSHIKILIKYWKRLEKNRKKIYFSIIKYKLKKKVSLIFLS